MGHFTKWISFAFVAQKNSMFVLFPLCSLLLQTKAFQLTVFYITDQLLRKKLICQQELNYKVGIIS